MYSDDSQKADARLEQVIEVIKNQDNEALKAMFSEQALDEAVDIDGRIVYLLDFIQGNIESWKRDTWSADKSIHDGKTTNMITSWYKVSTDKEDYLFFLLEYSEDTDNPDNVGLYTLRVIKAEDEETQFSSWQKMQIAGIYKPEE